MKLVWHHPAMRQKDWIRFLFGGLVTEEVEDPDFACFDDDTIHVVSMIFHPLRAMEDYFKKCRVSCRNIVLYHAGDEWFSGGCSPYGYFDNVVRELPSFFTRSEGVACVPLGSPTVVPVGLVVKPSSQRALSWSFAGEIRNTRIEMIQHFNRVPNGRLIDTNTSAPLSTAVYNDLIGNSVFAPCGMGNIITETWRVYESIEAGAIPIAEKRLTLDYYKELLGPNPIPTFGNWADAARFANRTMADEAAMDALQAEVMTWWASYKQKLVIDIAELLSTSHNAQLGIFGDSLANRNMVVHEGLRVMELMRHQSASNIKRRLANPMAPVRRILLGLTQKDER
jgi:hypothetical protein